MTLHTRANAHNNKKDLLACTHAHIQRETAQYITAYVFSVCVFAAIYFPFAGELAEMKIIDHVIYSHVTSFRFGSKVATLLS